MLKESKKFQFHSKDIARLVCGVSDTRIDFLEKLLHLKLIPRDVFLQMESENKENLELGNIYFNELEKYYTINKLNFINNENERQYQELYEAILHKVQNSNANISTEPIFVRARGLPIYTKGPRQKEYIDSMLKNPVTICIGAAGTGKTFLSIAVACKLLMSGKRNQLIITRPAVEAGESLGFLPGDLEQKIDPYLRPLYDALYECLSRKQVNEMILNRQIEIAPLAYMRGRTLNDAVVLLDESQNCTLTQLKMFLTRLGRNSSMCVSGDVTQVDLPPGQSGLAYVAEILNGIPEIGVIYFKNEDIVRNPIVEKIIKALDFEKNKKTK